MCSSRNEAVRCRFFNGFRCKVMLGPRSGSRSDLLRPERSLQTRLVVSSGPPTRSEVTVCLLHPISKGQPGALCILKFVEAVHLARRPPSGQHAIAPVHRSRASHLLYALRRQHGLDHRAHQPTCIVCHGQNLQTHSRLHAVARWWRSWTASGRTDLP